MQQVRGSFLYVLRSIDPNTLLVGDGRAVTAYDRLASEVMAVEKGNATPGLFETSELNGHLVISRVEGPPKRVEPVLSERLESDVASKLD
jgi:hypothetical protein